MINFTSETPIPEIIETIKNNITIPSLIILFLAYLVFDPLISWAFKSKNTNWGKYWGKYFIVATLMAIVLIFLIYSGNSVEAIVNFFTNLMN